jgi:hypothetical protein
MKNMPALNNRLVHLAVWLPALILLLVAGSGTTYAQTGGNYSLTWWTVDSGGSGGGIGTEKQVAGGPYQLLSTVGQPEAAAGIAGGGYTLQNGFWPGAITYFNTYLPVIVKLHPPPPDLVGSFTLTPPGPGINAGAPVTVNVVITNQGGSPAGGFWVDFYINPAGTPTVNKRWNDLCSMNPCYGLAWYVAGLGAGQSVNLSSNSFAATHSVWPGYFAGGTTNLHLYVDSWNPGVSSGSVSELNEANNLYTYPGGVVVTGLAPAAAEKTAADLPLRPARLE